MDKEGERASWLLRSAPHDYFCSSVAAFLSFVFRALQRNYLLTKTLFSLQLA
jgi:hypothetical protein